MITIGKPEITCANGRARLSARIEETGGGREILVKTLWYEVDARYAEGLSDRADAFVVALLYWAMVYHQDITCLAPMTERLHYQVQEILCPVMAQNSTRFRAPKITAPLTREPLQTQGAVGSGCSGGIDSFHVIANFTEPAWPSLKLTHLCTFSVGHLYERTDAPETLALVRAAELRADAVAKRLGLETCHVHSNYNELFPQTLLYMAVYADMACVHALGRLFGAYFYASDGKAVLDLANQECRDSSEYDLFSLPNLSTASLALYSEGAGTMRWQKVRRVADFPPATEMLNVCCQELRNCGPSDGESNRNCGICDKCQRTLLEADAQGLLERFGSVFDLEAYHNGGKRLALRYMLRRHLVHDAFLDFAWENLHPQLRLSDWIAERKAVLRAGRNALRKLFHVNRVPRFKDPREGSGQ